MDTSTAVVGHSVCPHDCPSACALDVEIVADGRIGRVKGAEAQTYTAGVICAKVARYAERIHHPDRLLHPLRRTGPKGSRSFERVSWDVALDEIARRLLQIESEHGAASIWPYKYAGTMGLVQRDGLDRLTHVKGYSRQYDTICTNMAWTGYVAGTGRLAGPDPREIARADCVVIWGTNAVATQVNVMTHAIRARKERKAKIVVVDIYQNDTMKQADMPLLIRPGSDGALACAVMHVLFRDGLADRDYLARYSDDPQGLEAHLQTRSPEWAAGITGLPVEEIEAFSHLVGTTRKTYFRLGYGFTRSRNGAVNMHAALSIPVVTGAFQYEGGGGFHSNSGAFTWNRSLIEGHDARDTRVRALDQSQIGRILTGDAAALQGGPAVKALFIQNTNPMCVAPEQSLVRQGFARDDLFTVVHEQFMTETAEMADIVLPATMFLEHDDIYSGGGHQHATLGPKLVEPPGECRCNHDVVAAIAKRVGAAHRGFDMTPREIVDWTLRNSGYGTFEEMQTARWRDIQPDFRTAHYLDGFAWRDGKFRFKPQWTSVPIGNNGAMGPHESMPVFPDHWNSIETADQEHPYRLATSPARSFLNSTFNQTPSSMAREIEPTVMMHPEDASGLGVKAGEIVRLGNRRGDLRLKVRIMDGLRKGVVIAEGLFPNAAHLDGRGINTLTGADQVAPFGGAAFHDSRVWIRRA
ncbi:MAG: molybdopterin oxidoreductase family protein [Beijerinckiaceae bacterium]|nr:molybdopterin oxidoreductase family protein [Beijerinckiaceae bacterium]